MIPEESRSQSITQILEWVERYWSQAAHHTIEQREGLLGPLLLQIGESLLQTSVEEEVAAAAEPDLTCPCGGQRHYESRPHGRQIQTRVGTLRLPPRARYWCTSCQSYSYPGDELLGLVPGQRMSRWVEEQCGFLAAQVPYAASSAILEHLVGITVCPSQVWRAVQHLGQREEAEQQVAYQTLQAYPDPVPATTERQYVGADGVMYCGRDQTPEGTYQWHELKTAAVYDAQPILVDDHHRAAEIVRHQGDLTLPLIDQAQTITYVASAQSWEDLGHQTQVELQRRGPQRDRVALGDGAESVQAFFDTYVRAAGVHLTRILDIRHAEQHLWEVAVLLPEPEQPWWRDTAFALLERGEASALSTFLLQTVSASPEGADLRLRATRAAAYVRRHAAHIDYLGFIDRHLQIGSGVAESTCKRFGTDRMKGTGMRWSRNGAHHVAIVRAKLLNHRWPPANSLAA